MRISAIIPTLNEAAAIADAVQRARAAGADEVIVADGHSADGTAERAAALGCRVAASPAGRGTQLNAGARIASGEVLLFLHADTWLEPGAVEQIRRAMADRAVRGGAFRQRIEAAGWSYRWLEWGNAQRVRWQRLPYGDQGIFLRRDEFDALGGFPEVPLMEDYLLMRRFGRRARPALLPGPLHVSARRWERHGVVRQTIRNWLLAAACRMGAPPERLAEYYRRHDR